MAFYIVVHHPSDPNQLWANEWEEQTLLRSITTPKNIAVRLAEAKARGERIFVHRCAWGTYPAEVCCSAMISEVHDIDKTTAFVIFAGVKPVGLFPSVTPHSGQSFYGDRPPQMDGISRGEQGDK